ncbi:alpha carbonic anhydrase 4-like [Corylus avellana]|uniref:alpha carbonic anhydrase 4-like n=1 Tax=Corylus avellana TaxID=13451 RepID=UPI00286B8337|nr:alpha carbonic anhydrase 4-like [Corylus avellana]XP_059462825.1 alpha carbonic anhydrase 4-like [Corylus avellana]
MMIFFQTNPTTIFVFLISLILSSHHFSTALNSEADAHETPFSYIEGSGTGPKEWGQLDPQWKACGNGARQSPIDIEQVQVSPNLGELERQYNPAPSVLVNSGHAIAVQWKQDVGKIIINGADYKLQQCHWHSPSEHTINGSRYDLEIHVVHQSSSGKFAVVGILYKYGCPDPFLAKLYDQVKSIGKGEEKDLGTINPEDLNFNSKEYYRYDGSLTTPPCTEGVTWTIFKEVKTASKEQVDALKAVVDEGFQSNARPTQQANGRLDQLYSPI